MSTTTTLDPKTVYAGVQEHYGSTAKNNNTDSDYGARVASAFGYSKEELTNAPAESNLGLSCGNPLAIANLREGETVIDLGSGAGFDVFQAAKKVGSSGKDMLERANGIKRKINVENASFVNSKLTNISLPDATADCIISNCVINLVPEAEKPSAYSEMFRLLKPDGRIAVSDILLKQDMPYELKSDMALLISMMSLDALIVADNSDLNVYKTSSKDNEVLGCCGPASKSASSCSASKNEEKEVEKQKDINLNQWAGSFKIYAVKPRI
ncbi:MAG: hypothetical protein L6R41_000317 [Letrouitia leprolyta]|nr:MAG: hypothetical protein L6R41_000317 [Letrouitia leprolyta]